MEVAFHQSSNDPSRRAASENRFATAFVLLWSIQPLLEEGLGSGQERGEIRYLERQCINRINKFRGRNWADLCIAIYCNITAKISQ